MPRVLQIAMQHAVGRGGVAVIVLSGDVALEEVLLPKLRHNLLLQKPLIRPSDGELAALAALINGKNKGHRVVWERLQRGARRGHRFV